jgi:hypothetical protein
MYEQQSEGKAIAMLAIVGMVSVMSFSSLWIDNPNQAEQLNTIYHATAITPPSF